MKQSKLKIAMVGLSVLCGATQAAWSACIDLSSPRALDVVGRLRKPIFPGPPNYQDISQGDAREPAYILVLSDPICVVGVEFLAHDSAVDRVQLLPSVSVDLEHMVGSKIRATGVDAFGAHTGHHHAPLLMTVTSAVRLN